jgi:NAD(P)-dependent dehydrogenase (short-subunit alcohol dehydrogenase family)
VTDDRHVDAYASALVTGGGSGLGRALALSLAADGTDVLIVGRTESRLRETAAMAGPEGGRVTYAVCDLRDADAVAELFAGLQTVPYILVNNAAGAFVALAEDVTPSGWTAVVRSTLDSTFYVSSSWMKARVSSHGGGGVILNISSATCAGGSPGTVHSGAAKSGVTSMSKTLAIEWARFGIRVNALEAGAFHTDGGATQIWAEDGVAARIESAVALGRIADVDEMVQPARFLVSPGASYMTGSIVKVDGGWSLNSWLYITPDNRP